MKKILTVIGARPQFIKASVVSNAINKVADMSEVLVHTGQHFDSSMSDVFFDQLEITRPDYSLGINGGRHGEMTGRMLVAIEEVLLKEKPDVVLVYGDTNSTLAGALAAAKLHYPIAHVEAGLRSFNILMPEEINRILTDRISNWLFAPTHSSVQYLINEGYGSDRIHLVGDVMYDVALHYGSKVDNNSGLIKKLGLSEKGYILVTIHRAENTDNALNLINIVDAFISLSRHLPVVWPLHPRTKLILEKLGKLNELATKLHIIEPIGYLEMVQLEKYSAIIVTDSGGVQKEAFFFKVPCVTLRTETEWVELVEAGWNQLVPPNGVENVENAILSAIGTRGKEVKPYGEGNAAEVIINTLMR